MNRAFIIFAAVVLLVGLCGFSEPATAAPGDLDTSFSLDGKIVDTLSGVSTDRAAATAVQAGGKILAAGAMAFGNDRHVCGIVRYYPNGTLDETFDGDGKIYAQTSQSSQLFTCRAIAVQADGEIIVAGGTSPTGSSDFGLMRFNPNGSIDASFGNAGKVTTNIDGYDSANALAIEPDGKIVAAGGALLGGQGDFALVRYNTDGSLDASFDGDGKVTTNVLGGDNAYAVAVQRNGRIVVAGYSYPGANNNEASLARYNADGSLDTSFGTGGTRTFDMNGASNDFVYGMALDATDRIVVAGETSGSITVARILSDFGARNVVRF